MKTYGFNRHTFFTAIFASPILLMSVYAQAEDATPQTTPNITAEPVSPWTANVTLTTRYVTRGFISSWNDPALQGGVDYTHPSGFNIGTWLSTVSDKYIQKGTVEWDLYAGYTHSFGDLALGAQLYYYYYPDAGYDAYGGISKVKYNYGEIVPTLSYKWFSAKYWYTYTKDYFGVNEVSTGLGGRGDSQGSGYLDLNLNYDLGNNYSLQAHYGHQAIKNYQDLKWDDAKLGVTKSFDGGWSASLAATKGWSDSTFWTAFPNVKDISDTKNLLGSSLILSATKLF